MDSLPYGFLAEDSTPIFSAANDIATTTNTDSLSMGASVLAGRSEDAFAPLAPVFHGRSANELLNLLSQQEPRAGDTAPASTSSLEDRMMNFRTNGSETPFDDTESGHHSYFMGSSAESVVSSRSNLWSEASGSRPNDTISTFEFLIKSVSAANNYVSMLTREQLTVLQALRPSLLFEILQEVAKIRSDKRMRRALPHECAFCKNNGENEECYTTHALKDGRGRVLCPVLRAFHCPRCGATGDRAHTIKYCSESDGGLGVDRGHGVHPRRRAPPSASLFLGAPGTSSARGTPPPPPSPAGHLPHANPWSIV